jgi:hypothetical protein
VGATSGTLVNTNPKPRVLIIGLNDEPQLQEELASSCPTVTRVDRLSDVRQEEWDLLLTDRPLYDTPDTPNIRQSRLRAVELAPHISVVYRMPPGTSGFVAIKSRSRWNGRIERFWGLKDWSCVAQRTCQISFASRLRKPWSRS